MKVAASDRSPITISVKKDGKIVKWPANNVFTSDGFYEVLVRDSAGNVSKAIFHIDTKVPLSPNVNKITTQSTTITGTAEKGVSVYVKIGSKTYRTESNANGAFTVSIPRQKKGTKVFVYAQDQAQNKSTEKTLEVF